VRLGDVELFTIALPLLLSAGAGYFVYKLAALLFDSTRVGLLAALLERGGRNGARSVARMLEGRST
jgi:hypothetical protein